MSRQLVDRRVLPDKRQIALAVARSSVKTLLRRAEQWRLSEPKCEKTPAKELEPQRVHLLEWPGLPGVAPFHRAIHRHNVRGNLWSLRQRVVTLGEQQLSEELRVTTAGSRERVQAIVERKPLDELEVRQRW